LEDSINAYLPFPVRTPTHPEVPITFKMLLTHTSSIQDNWNVLSQLYAPGDPTIPLGTFLSDYLTPGGQYYSASQNFYSQIPGTYWSYCNVGAALAGYLVEILTSVPFDEYCKDSIFVLLNMSNTAWFLRDLDTSLVAHPYGYWGGAYHDYGLYGYPDYPDGLLRTALPSLAKFLVMNIKGGESNGIRLLDTSTVRLIRTVHIPIIPPPWNLYQWGLIWMKPLWSDYDIWGHTGYDDGVTTAMFLRESDDTGVILLTNADGDQPYKAAVDRLFDEITVGIEEVINEIPTEFALEQNYPNPFNPTTTIGYGLQNKSNVKITVLNAIGEEVAVMLNEEREAGFYQVEFNAASLPSGVYFYQLKAGDFIQSKKMILLR
jgi:CubicO group peptidase (beta-lactamase class C family)